MNASIRLSLAVLAVVLSACAAQRDAAEPPRAYREPLSAAEPALRSGQESPTVLRSHERPRRARERDAFTTGHLGH